MRVTRNGKSGLNQRLLCATGYRIIKYNSPFLLCIITTCTIYIILYYNVVIINIYMLRYKIMCEINTPSSLVVAVVGIMITSMVKRTPF